MPAPTLGTIGMNCELIEQVLECKELPSLPAIAAQVIELTSDEQVSMDELARTITNDQGLAAKILRTINSSFYGLREPVSTIKRAVVLMGLKPVKTLALSFSLVTAIKENEDPKFDYDAYWRRGLYTGIAARVLLESVGKKDQAEEAFLGGLLQDVGMLALHRVLGDKYLAILTQTEGDHRRLASLELEHFETQHTDIGAMLCERWKLPEQLVTPVKFHERPTAAPPSTTEIVRAVAIGNLIHDVLTAENAAEPMKDAYKRSERWFGLRTDAVDEIIRRTSEAAGELASLFEISTGPSSNADEIIHRASERLDAIEHEDPTAAAIRDGDTLTIDRSQLDELTGVFNADGFKSVIRSAFAFAKAKSEALVVVIISLDGFTQAVRAVGEGSDGEIAMEATRLLREQFDPLAGVLGRLADDVFGVVVASTDASVVRSYADTFRSAFEESAASITEGAAPLGASIGLAAIRAGEQTPFASGEQMLAGAIRAAQAAQKAGGNTTRLFRPKAA